MFMIAFNSQTSWLIVNPMSLSGKEVQRQLSERLEHVKCHTCVPAVSLPLSAAPAMVISLILAQSLWRCLVSARLLGQTGE